MRSPLSFLLNAKEIGGEFVDEREVHHGPLEDYLATLLGICQCCNVETLELAAVHEAFLHFLDHRELTEHGGSVRNSWLTPEGEKVLELLRRWDKERRAAQPS